MVSQRATRVAPANVLDVVNLQESQRGAATDIRAREPHALFGARGHDGDTTRGPCPSLAISGCNRETTYYASRPIITSASPHRIQMRPHEVWRLTIALAR